MEKPIYTGIKLTPMEMIDMKLMTKANVPIEHRTTFFELIQAKYNLDPVHHGIDNETGDIVYFQNHSDMHCSCPEHSQSSR